MYNFALAFVLCAAVYIIGEVVSTATKAWIPSVFVTAAIILVGYWTVLPTPPMHSRHGRSSGLNF